MLSVIIPTEGVEQPAVATLAALVPGAAAAPPLAVDGDRKLGKRSRTRRFGGQLHRRVLEGMRGCSAHEANIAR